MEDSVARQVLGGQKRPQLVKPNVPSPLYSLMKLFRKTVYVHNVNHAYTPLKAKFIYKANLFPVKSTVQLVHISRMLCFMRYATERKLRKPQR